MAQNPREHEDEIVHSIAGLESSEPTSPAPPSLDHPTVLIGPEGGWSDAERRQLDAIRISSSVLRSETAAIGAAALLTALRDGLTSVS